MKNRKTAPLALIVTGLGLMVIAVAGIVFVIGDNKLDINSLEVGPVPQKVNYAAPSLRLYDLSGKPVSIEGRLGKVILINNWATWCPPCRAEMPDLEKYYQAHKADGFDIIALNAGDEPGLVEEFVLRYALTFPVWLDPDGLAIHAFRNNALPSSYVIDRSGTVRLVWIGEVSVDALETYVTPLLFK